MSEILEELTFQQFLNEDALTFGLKVLEIVDKENLKNVRIRVRYNNDIVFQYLMNDKLGEEWLNRKENTVMKSGHSSLYVLEHREDYLYMENDANYAICGGGYPLIVNGELKGAFCVSGLDHLEDHQLIIKALKEMRK